MPDRRFFSARRNDAPRRLGGEHSSLTAGAGPRRNISAAPPPPLPAPLPAGRIQTPAAALARAIRTLAQSPRDFAALIMAGRAALDLGDTQAAIGFFGRAEEVRPSDPAPKIGMGAATVIHRRCQWRASAGFSKRSGSARPALRSVSTAALPRTCLATSPRRRSIIAPRLQARVPMKRAAASRSALASRATATVPSPFSSRC